METIHEKLQKLLEETFNSEGDILILAVAITPLENSPLALGPSPVLIKYVLL